MRKRHCLKQHRDPEQGKGTVAPGFCSFKLAFKTRNACCILGTGRNLQVLILVKNCSLSFRIAVRSVNIFHQSHPVAPVEPQQPLGSSRCWSECLSGCSPVESQRWGSFGCRFNPVGSEGAAGIPAQAGGRGEPCPAFSLPASECWCCGFPRSSFTRGKTE